MGTIQQLADPEQLKIEKFKADTERMRQKSAKQQQTFTRTTDTLGIFKGLFTAGALMWIFLGPGVLIAILKLLEETNIFILMIILLLGIYLWRR